MRIADASDGPLSSINLQCAVRRRPFVSPSVSVSISLMCPLFSAQIYAERDIMTFVDNPFVVSLYCSFETQVLVLVAAAAVVLLIETPR